MSRWTKALSLSLALALATVAPALSAPNLFDLPAGRGAVGGVPRNTLGPGIPRRVHLDRKFMRQINAPVVL